MDYYTPLFSKIIDSSLWDEPDHVRIVFITMLAKKDADMVVRANAYNISRWARKTEAEVLEALKALAAPDKRRLEPQAHDGRRIEKVEDGWMILNGKHYQELMRKAHQRNYNAGKQKEYRAKKKEKGVSAKYRGSESRFNDAYANGNDTLADKIAAEGLPEKVLTETPQPAICP